MATSTYGDLRDKVASWLQRADLATQVPDFIEFATARLSRELRVPQMETIASTTLAAEWTALPEDFEAIRTIEADGKVLEYKTPFQLQRAIQLNQRPDPPIYSIQDMQFRVYPFPTATPVEIGYYATIPQMVNNTDTNWLLTKWPDVYLRACLLQAREFLHDDPRMQMMETYVNKFIRDANRAGKQAAVGSGPLAVKVA